MVLAQETDISATSVERLCEFGDMVPQQNLQQLFYKTACAGFAVLGDTNRYTEIYEKIMTKSFTDVFHEKCFYCRGIGVTDIDCPECQGNGCPHCNQTGKVRGHCPNCGGTAAVFSKKKTLDAYHRGLQSLVNAYNSPKLDASTPSSEKPESVPEPRLSDDMFFVKHSIHSNEYVALTNKNFTSIQRTEFRKKLNARACLKNDGFVHTLVFLKRIPSGVEYEVTDVAQQKGKKYANTRYLLIPSSETGVAQWKKGKVLTSRDWIGTVNASSALDGFPHLMDIVLYRSVSEFRQFNPQGQE